MSDLMLSIMIVIAMSSYVAGYIRGMVVMKHSAQKAPDKKEEFIQSLFEMNQKLIREAKQ